METTVSDRNQAFINFAMTVSEEFVKASGLYGVPLRANQSVADFVGMAASDLAWRYSLVSGLAADSEPTRIATNRAVFRANSFRELIDTHTIADLVVAATIELVQQSNKALIKALSSAQQAPAFTDLDPRFLMGLKNGQPVSGVLLVSADVLVDLQDESFVSWTSQIVETQTSIGAVMGQRIVTDAKNPLSLWTLSCPYDKALKGGVDATRPGHVYLIPDGAIQVHRTTQVSEFAPLFNAGAFGVYGPSDFSWSVDPSAVVYARRA